ncbi:ABC transporter substrate-binding protein [Pararhizobium sp. YC-54]|uniref:substrate-binding periplasmic protein n=1 Tax=Pararhizobium sp. YC-54 TaxID=2986920 RepID=UPI0021F6E934|nr:transporter substrate-binding domain-containing protein [Pararhizobium sp. YC-54]MCW0001725.1 ABC transporter substrate-binding protein [Pararhizobium sp. YC-54]
MTMKSLTAAAVVLFGTMSSTSFAADGCLEQIKNAGVLTAGTANLGVRPFLWQDESKTYGGFEWEIFKEIGQRIGAQDQKFVSTEWPTLIPGLKSGRWDIILSGMSATQERIQGADIRFSDPYFLLHDVVVVKSTSEIKSASDLKGKTLASTLGTLDSLNAHNLVSEGAAAEMRDFNDFGTPFVALRNGQVDAVVMDQATVMAQQEAMSDLRVLEGTLYYRAKPEWEKAEAAASYKLGGVAVGVRKECPDLLAAVNEALASMSEDGTRKAILEKYRVWSENQVKLTK